jgi:hypothetical protein
MTDASKVYPPTTNRDILRAAFGTLVSTTAAPYGYTVAVWSSGSLLIHIHHTPDIGEVFLFAAGALAGFGLLGILARGSASRGAQLDHPPDRVLSGVLNWFAVGIAIGAAALLAQIHCWVAWPLASFMATTLYLLGASLQLALVSRRQRATIDRLGS